MTQDKAKVKKLILKLPRIITMGISGTITLYVLVVTIVAPVLNTFLLPYPNPYSIGETIRNGIAAILMVLGLLYPLSWVVNHTDRFMKRFFP